MWCVLVSMTTVGYGDIIPRTNLSRLFAVGACFAGQFILSLLTIAIRNRMNLDQYEANIFQYFLD